LGDVHRATTPRRASWCAERCAAARSDDRARRRLSEYRARDLASTSAASIDEAVLDDGPERRDAVAPADLLAGGVVSTRVADRNFDDLDPHACHLRGQLGLDGEPSRADLDALEDLAAERLVAGLHVRQVEPGEQVADERQEAVAEVVVQGMHPRRVADQEA